MKTNTLIAIDKANAKSECWKSFQIVATKQGIDAGFVICRHDGEIFKYNSSTGCTRLTNHHNSKHANQMVLQQFSKSRVIPPDVKAMIKDAQVDFAIGTMISYSVQECDAFYKFCDTMIKIGNSYGPIESCSILTGRKGISNQVKSKVKDLPELLIKHQKNKFTAFTSDIWSSKFTNDSFLELHSVWADGPHIKTCQVDMVRFDQKHTASNIREKIIQIIDGIGKIDSPIFITTDCGANMLKAVEDFRSFKCACHRLSTSIELGWKMSMNSDESLNNLEKACNTLQTSLSHSVDIQSKLPRKIKPGCRTRAWRGLATKFESINASYSTLCQVLDNKKKNLIYSINEDDLKTACDFFQIFPAIFDNLEKSDKPSLNLVVPVYYALKKKFVISNEDSETHEAEFF